MRIVKVGTPQFDLYGTCKRCDCEVECQKSDEEVKSQYNGDWEPPTYFCKCPTEYCNETIWLTEVRR